MRPASVWIVHASFRKCLRLCLIPAFLALTTSGCAKVVYEHRDMTQEDYSASKRQIYRMWVNGWFKRNISNRPQDEKTPHVRLDGKKIVFLDSNNQISVMDIDGRNPAPVPNSPMDVSAPRWSRSGSFILFSYPSSYLQSAIHRIGLDGTGLTRITNPSATQQDDFASSIDDKHIVFTRYDVSNNQDRDLYIKYIWDDSPEVRLTNTPNASETLPVISHAGTLLAYRVTVGSGAYERVNVARVDLSGQLTVLHEIELPLPAEMNISGISFSKGDQELFVSIGVNDVPGTNLERKQEIFRVGIDGSHQRRLTNNHDRDISPSAIP